MISRRLVLGAASAYGLAACAPKAPAVEPPPPIPPLPARYGAMPEEPYPVPAVPEGVVPEKLWRTEVENPFPFEPVGTVIVDPQAAYLHLITSESSALRYGVSVGAAGYGWSGDARVQFRRKWPVWKAPDTMIERRPEFAPYSVANGGMPPGPGNPLGARALYLFQDGKDTLYRIHGACEPAYLGKAVSSGCIRMLDQDVIDLHDRVRDGAKVRVLPSVAPSEFLVPY
jgi:lipoprotein-anchoring transpeptidase ErfK/SrfK